MTLKVIDISSYQTSDAVNTPGTDAVIVKVSQGTGYINPQCDSQYQEAKLQGKLLGLYHYLSGVDAKAEARFFVDNSTGYWQNDPVTLWADWEGGDNGAWGNGAYVAEFIAEVNRLVGVACCGIYTGVDGVNQTGSYLAATTPLWFAGYPDLRDSWDAPDFMYSIKPWETLTMWQFTDSEGRLDRSIFYGDANTWNKLSVKPNGGSKPAPKPQPAPTTVSYSTSGKNLKLLQVMFNQVKLAMVILVSVYLVVIIQVYKLFLMNELELLMVIHLILFWLMKLKKDSMVMVILVSICSVLTIK